MEDKVEILAMYIKSNPSILECVKNMMEYRDLRTEQAFCSRLANDYRWDNSSNPMIRKMGELDYQYYKDRSVSLDRMRRATHNSALHSFMRMVEYGNEHSLTPLYEGKTLEHKDIDEHNRGEVREEITDFMFGLLYEIEESNIEKLKEKEERLGGVKKELEKDSDKYDVSKPFTKDEKIDGNVKFRFER